MRNLGKDFSEKKICVKVENIGQINNLSDVVNNWLFEDTHVIISKMYHGVYGDLFRKGYELSMGITDGYAEILSDNYFKENGYEQVSYKEFIQNLREN